MREILLAGERACAQRGRPSTDSTAAEKIHLYRSDLRPDPPNQSAPSFLPRSAMSFIYSATPPGRVWIDRAIAFVLIDLCEEEIDR
jgi:hypothetical protein